MTDPLPTRPWQHALAVALLGLTAACGNGEAASSGTAEAGPDSGHAVVLLYHHVADGTPPSTSVTPETFERHLDYLADHDYQVLPVSRIVAALADPGAEPLPPRAVGITFDDAYESVYTEAAPRLERRDMPYAVFVSTDYIDQGFGNYMSWAQLRELEQAGGEMANHSRNHGHYVHRRPGESAAEWRSRIARDIESAQERLVAELARPLEVLAYPYGEFDPALTELARELGFVAFGQQSGPVGPGSDLQALPRFPMATGYADVDALAEKLRTRPFRVEVRSEVGPVLAPDAGPPTLRLRLAAEDARLDALSCFVTGQERPEVRWVDRPAGVVAITARRALPVGRTKYTCTAPSTAGGGVFFWYSHLWMKPPAEGEWYAD